VTASTTAPAMDRTWLVQRLSKPTGAATNPFTFGGGLREGGLSQNALALLRELWTFDYMGSAEFEWGAVPKALQRIAKAQATLRAFSFQIPLRDVAPDWRDKTPPPDSTATVYVLCPGQWAAEVQDRICGLARDGYRAHLKESANLSNALRPFHDWDIDTVGWLELDNGFLFFTDRTMWANTCTAFGVEVPGVAA
jgi:hypothetical protein